MSNEVPRNSAGLVVGLIVVGVIALAGAGVGALSYTRTAQLEKQVKALNNSLPSAKKGAATPAVAAPAAGPRRKGKGKPAATAPAAAATKPAVPK